MTLPRFESEFFRAIQPLTKKKGYNVYQKPNVNGHYNENHTQNSFRIPPRNHNWTYHSRFQFSQKVSIPSSGKFHKSLLWRLVKLYSVLFSQWVQIHHCIPGW